MGYKIGREPATIRTPSEKVERLDGSLSKKSFSQEQMKEWRNHDRKYFIEFWNKRPDVYEYRVIQKPPKEGRKVLAGRLTDAYLTKQCAFTSGHIFTLYVVVKKEES